MMEVILFTSKRRMQYSNIKKWHPQFQHLYKLRILTRKICVLHERDSQAFSPHLKRSRGTEHGGYSFLLKSFANCRPRKRVCYKLELCSTKRRVQLQRKPSPSTVTGNMTESHPEDEEQETKSTF